MFNQHLQTRLATLLNEPLKKLEQTLGERGLTSSLLSANTIRIDILETVDKVIIHADLPNVSKQDTQIKLDGNNLTISVNFPKPRDHDEVKYLLDERLKGVYERTIALPESADLTTSDAEFRHSVLTIVFNKLVQERRASANTINIR